MKIDAFKLKHFVLLVPVILTACGGGNTDSYATEQTTERITATASNIQEPTFTVDDLASLKQVSSWLTFASDQLVSAQLASSTHLIFSNDATNNADSGLFVSTDFAQKHWEEIIEPALNTGRIVVIEALSQADGESAIETLTIEHLGVGIVGKAVMLSKASSGYQAAGFAATEVVELINAMRAVVGKTI